MSEDENFQRLCQAQIEGTATESESAQLAALIRDHDWARLHYVQQMRIHAMLTWQHGRSQAVLAQIPPPANVVRWTPRRWMATAAALMVLCGLAAWWQVGASRSGTAFEVLTATDVSFRVGERAQRRTLEIERGSLSFRLTSGAVVDVSGPARVELLSPMHLRVLRGTVTADISDGEKGFVVDTEQAHVVDLGTRFSVSAGTKAGTDVVVFTGKVEVFGPSGKATAERPKITLTEGEAIRLDRDRQPKRLKMVRLGADAQTLKGAAQSDIVSAVTDNVSEPSFRRYYGLVRGAMSEGARVYTSGHTRTWHPMPGATFPQELEGADGICTFDFDRRNEDLQITLQISRPCDLYLMTDARRPAPKWVQAEFTDTGYRLRSGPWIPREVPITQYEAFYHDESAYVPYVVWRKRIPEAGPVTLGSTRDENQRGIPAMYSLAVKAL